jgi:NAD(P)-dependent dehydrogenase (short-subunit alcohol dehydrogenase family)
VRTHADCIAATQINPNYPAEEHNVGSLFSSQGLLVVGGSSGIGLATALSALEAGADVTIASRSASKLEDARRQSGNRLRAWTLDTADNDAVEGLFQANGPFHHVVVSASATKGGPIRDLPLVDAYASMESKFWGAYRVARAARIHPEGSLTIVSGFLSRRPSATSVLQGAINAALEGLVRGLALEFSPVRVNAVSPGLIDTPLYAKMPDDKRDALYQATGKRLPVQRIGAADDVARAILFAAANRFTTGSVITVDGGGTIA